MGLQFEPEICCEAIPWNGRSPQQSKYHRSCFARSPDNPDEASRTNLEGLTTARSQGAPLKLEAQGQPPGLHIQRLLPIEQRCRWQIPSRLVNIDMEHSDGTLLQRCPHHRRHNACVS
jgi:hypothetical protein